MFRSISKTNNTNSIFIARLLMIVFIVILIIALYSVEMFTALLKALESCFDGECRNVLLYNFYLFSKRSLNILGVVFLKQKSITNLVVVVLLVATVLFSLGYVIQQRLKINRLITAKIELRKIIVGVFPKKLE